MLVRIVTTAAEHLAWQIDGEDLPFQVGRHPEVRLRLNDPLVSDLHCRIDEFQGLLWVCDLGSAHGTFVNGVRIDESALLPGDRLTVGATQLRIHYQRQPAPRLVVA